MLKIFQVNVLGYVMNDVYDDDVGYGYGYGYGYEDER